jgi:hypothetical protein
LAYLLAFDISCAFCFALATKKQTGLGFGQNRRSTFSEIRALAGQGGPI